MNGRIIAIYLLAAVSLPVLAAEETKIWSGDVEVGAVFTSGNTEQESLKLRFDATRDKDKFINSFHADTFQASASGDDTADKFYTSPPHPGTIRRTSFIPSTVWIIDWKTNVVYLGGWTMKTMRSAALTVVLLSSSVTTRAY